MLHSLLGPSLCAGQMEKNAVDNKDSSHGGAETDSYIYIYIVWNTRKKFEIVKPRKQIYIYTHKYVYIDCCITIIKVAIMGIQLRERGGKREIEEDERVT